MSALSKITTITIAGAALLLLSACGGAGVQHGTDSATAASLIANATGNVLQNSVGDRLSFVSENNEPLGTITSTSQQGSSIYVSLFNNNTGRKALVRVDIDPNSQKFLTVNATSAPYMCYDVAVNPCAAYTVPTAYRVSGQTVAINCSSPIYFNGAIKGSVSNINVTNSVTCGN